MSRRVLRVLVVDDSPLNRDEMVSSLASAGDTEVVGMASNGSEALERAEHVLVCGVARDDDHGARPHALHDAQEAEAVHLRHLEIQRDQVGLEAASALELGAVDFVAKPQTRAERLSVLPNVLKEKLEAVRALTPGVWSRPPTHTELRNLTPVAPSKIQGTTPKYFIALAASTGGPSAVTKVLSRLKADPRCAVVVAQHMPDTFTRTFAERLNRHSALEITEARNNATILGASALICPGRRCLEVQFDGKNFTTDVRFPGPQDRYVPSADRLFSSLANVAAKNTIAVVLTGMGDDGMEGAKALVRRGGTVIAESEETAVVYGMPQAVVRAGVVRRSLALDDIAGYLNDLTRA